MEYILCRVAESSYSPTHNIVPHTSFHDQPCHKMCGLRVFLWFIGLTQYIGHPTAS